MARVECHNFFARGVKIDFERFPIFGKREECAFTRFSFSRNANAKSDRRSDTVTGLKSPKNSKTWKCPLTHRTLVLCYGSPLLRACRRAVCIQKWISWKWQKTQKPKGVITHDDVHEALILKSLESEFLTFSVFEVFGTWQKTLGGVTTTLPLVFHVPYPIP